MLHLSNAFNMLRSLNEEVEQSNCKGFHMYNKYDISTMMSLPISVNNNLITRVLNGTIKGLNNKHWLLKYIIVFLEENFVSCAAVHPDCIMRWFLNCIWRALVAKREYLHQKSKPVYNTQVVVLKPLPKPIWNDLHGVYTDKKRAYQSFS